MTPEGHNIGLEDQGEKRESLIEKLGRMKLALVELEEAETQLKKQGDIVDQIAGELFMNAEQFVVELEYPHPLSEAYVVIDDEIIQDKPNEFVATGVVWKIRDGEAEFENLLTGESLKVKGGYNFRFGQYLEDKQ